MVTFVFLYKSLATLKWLHTTPYKACEEMMISVWNKLYDDFLSTTQILLWVLKATALVVHQLCMTFGPILGADACVIY